MIEVRGLTKVFETPTGPFVAVKDVNAVIRESEFVCILGHSGCGKSTVLSIVAGLADATYGGVVIDGKQVTQPGPERALVRSRTWTSSSGRWFDKCSMMTSIVT